MEGGSREGVERGREKELEEAVGTVFPGEEEGAEGRQEVGGHIVAMVSGGRDAGGSKVGGTGKGNDKGRDGGRERNVVMRKRNCFDS